MTYYLGSFDAEKYWKYPNYASLPTFHEAQSESIIDTMDELQFLFCEKKSDFLISSAAMNAVHRDYLHDIGFEFSNNQKDIKSTFGDGRSIFESLVDSDNGLFSNKELTVDDHFSSYAIIPHTKTFYSKYNIRQVHPPVDVIRQVNSKTFSSCISNSFSDTYSYVVTDISEFESLGNKLLETNSIIIKDPYGVSGKGSLHVNSTKTLKRIAAYLSKQQEEGKQIEFIIEQYLEKQIDFSCQFIIGPKGEIDIKGVQQMKNKIFNFYGIGNAGEALINYLEEKKYFGMVDKVGKILFERGYFGPVCLDSMILKNKDLIPVVEINARKSMGMLNLALNNFLSGCKASSSLFSISCLISRPVTFESLFYEFLKTDILLTKGKPNGLIPLSANTFDINTKLTDTYPLKGRLYVGVINEFDAEDNLMTSMNNVLINLGIKNLS